MAPKRSKPVEEPTVSPKRPKPMEEQPAEEEEDSDSSSSEGEEEEGTTPSAAIPSNIPAETVATASAQSNDDDSNDESDTESDSDDAPSTIMTIPSQTVAPKPSKSGFSSNPPSAPAESSVKRPAALFERIWSAEDEIAALKGMLEFSKMKGVYPLTQIAAFHEFIKKSFRVDFSRNQLVDKIKRLKKKYNNSLGKGKRGEKRTVTKPHEQKMFLLAEKLWGNGEMAKNPKVDKKALASDPEPVPSAGGNKRSNITNTDAALGPSQRSSNPNLHDENAGWGSSYKKSITKRLRGVIDESKKTEMEKKSRELEIAELELFLKHQDFIGEQARLLLECFKSFGY